MKKDSLTTKPLTVFPTRDSLDDVVREAEARAPIQVDDVYPLLATYHNTLLNLLSKEQ